MSFLEPSSKAIKNWQELDTQQQYAAIVWGAEYLKGQLKTYRDQMGAGVVSIGHGAPEFEWVDEDGNAWLDEDGNALLEHDKGSVIKVYVKDLDRFHESYTERTGRDEFPEFIQPSKSVPIQPPLPKKKKKKKTPSWRDKWNSAKPANRKASPKRRALALPISVTVRKEAEGDASPQKQRMAIVSGTQQNPPPPVALTGSACALVRPNDSTDPDLCYILSCHHVVWNSYYRRNMTKDTKARAWSVRQDAAKNDIPIKFIGTPDGPRINPNSSQNIDAGVIKLNDEGLKLARKSPRTTYWRARPSDWLRDEEQWAQIARPGSSGFTLYPWGDKNNKKPVKMKFYDKDEKFPVGYGTPNQKIKIKEVYIFKCTSGTRTHPGYSGSPIMMGGMQGGLVAMHIAGTPDGKGPPWYSFGIPIYHLMNKGGIWKPGFSLA